MDRKARSARYYQKHKAQIMERNRLWCLKNKEKVRAQKKRYRAKYPEKMKARKLKYALNHPERVKAQRKIYYEAHKKERFNWKLKNYYGITEEVYLELIKKQNNLCAICRLPPHGGKHNKLVIDHCHKNGKVRELLCYPCNVALGLFYENPKFLQSAINYLNSHGLS